MESSIQYWYDLCYQLFASLRGPLDDAPQYQAELSTETLLDLSGRFNIWAGNIGAGGQGRASLDYRLREASEIKDHIVTSLRYTHEALLNGKSNFIIRKSGPPRC